MPAKRNKFFIHFHKIEFPYCVKHVMALKKDCYQLDRDNNPSPK